MYVYIQVSVQALRRENGVLQLEAERDADNVSRSIVVDRGEGRVGVTRLTRVRVYVVDLFIRCPTYLPDLGTHQYGHRRAASAI